MILFIIPGFSFLSNRNKITKIIYFYICETYLKYIRKINFPDEE